MSDEQPSIEQLMEERDKLEALLTGLATAGIGIDVVRVDHRIVFQNDPIRQRFGDCAGRLCYEVYMGLEEPCRQCPMLKAIESGKAERAEVAAADGRHYELLSVPYVNSDGTVDKVIEVVQDVTERKRMEDALRQARDRLEEKVETRTAELAAANARLREEVEERKRAEETVLREGEKLRRMLESSDRERKLMAYEIHDGLTQHIAAAKMQLEAASQWSDEDSEAAARAYRQGLELLSRSMDDARRLISGLRPPVLDEAGVVAAIEHLAHDLSMREGPEVGFACNVAFSRLEPLLENTVFRIVQESVTNACRYSQSSKVQVRLTQQGSQVRIEVQDWGVGFDPADVPETSFGIGGIRERATLAGGRATIDSKPGRGTLVTVELPLTDNAIKEEGGAKEG